MEKTAEEVIEMIADRLRESDGETIAFIADQTLTGTIEYLGDSLFEVKD